MAAALMSCSKIEQDPQVKISEKQTLVIPIQNEYDDLNTDVKSYLSQPDQSSWNIVWESSDYMGFFQFRNGRQLSPSSMLYAPIERYGDGTVVKYTSDDFKAGDVIYTYLGQEVDNYDPSQFQALIPAYQFTNYGDEDMSRSTTHSFTIDNPGKLSKYTSSDRISSAIGLVAPSKTVSFKIKGYDPDLEYCCEGLSDFTVDYHGNASGTLVFNPIAESDENKDKFKHTTLTDTYVYEQTYTINVFVSGHSDKAAVISVLASASFEKGNIIGIVNKFNITYTCTLIKETSSFTTVETFVEKDKAFPIQDCMPCVSKAFTLSPYLLENPEDIQSNITMYMLGSVVEFRVYSSDNNIAVGEDLIGVQLSTDKGCAGYGTCDLISGNLTLGEMSDNVITSYDNHAEDKALIIKNSKNDYVSVYVVLAPGTYNATVSFFTLDKVYTLNTAQKTFKRAVKTNMNCNLANSVKIQTWDEFYAE